MPKRIYTVSRARNELNRNRLIVAGKGPRGDHRTLVLTGRRMRKRKRPTSFPVFEFLERELRREPFGARAIWAAERADGRVVEYVYEKGKKHYFLVERRHHPKEGGKPKIEKVPRPKSQVPKQPGKFSDKKVRATISREKEGRIKAVSLNERALTEKQKKVLEKAGWRRVQATETMAYWQSPKKK